MHHSPFTIQHSQSPALSLVRVFLLLLVLALAHAAQAQTKTLTVDGTGLIKAPVDAATFRSANGITDAANLTTGTLNNARLSSELTLHGTKEITLTNSSSSTDPDKVNVLSLQNLGTGASAVRVLDIAGVERGAFGYINPGTGDAFDNQTFVEFSDFTGAGGSPEFSIVQTGTFGGAYAFGARRRMHIDGDGTIDFLNTELTGRPLRINPTGTSITIGPSQSGALNFGDVNHSIVSKVGAVDNLTFYEYGGAKADGKGIKFYTGGVKASQTLRLQVADDGAEFSGPLVVPSVNGNTITTGTGTLTLAAGKTLTISNTLTFAGTNGSTLNIGTGGTLGTGAYATIANYAPLASPTFTNTPAAPTATAGTSTTQLATTAFVATAVSPTEPNFPTDSDVTTYVTNVASAGGTITSASVAVANRLVRGLKFDGLWSKITTLHFPLGDFAASKVALKSGSGAAAITYNSYVSGDWVESGSLRGLTQNGSRTLDFGINANTLTCTNVSLAYVRTGKPNAGTNTANVFGTNTALTELGIISSATSTLGGYGFVVANRLLPRTYYNLHRVGVFAGSGRAADSAYFVNGVKVVSDAAPSGTFASNNLKMQEPSGTRYGGGVIATTLTDTEHERLAYWLTAATSDMGCTLTQPQQVIQFIGDSLTYGMGPSFTQVTSPYFKQLSAAKRLHDGNTTSFMQGVIGQTMATINTNVATYQRLQRLGMGRNVVFLYAGVNDMLNSSATAATTYSALLSFCGALKATDPSTKIIVAALVPTTTISSGSPSNYNTQAPLFNTSLLGNAGLTDGSVADGIARLDTVPEFADTTNATYFNDGLHFTNAGYTLVTKRFLAKAEEAGALPGVSGYFSDADFAGTTQSLYERWGAGSPESVVPAPVGSVYHRTDGGTGTSNYFKETGTTTSTGWVAK